ncbi:hypothetical protein GGI25_006051 [Coemansia spiralis]|uniref:Uncharacterized protein n=2 Tax=Coemansia TaxID=4863 RepID=A0A9W8KVW2_9FUNG|nr:hypothetical protein GGI26_005557 [Coemansia sp. RSA 1358]KAJ2669764.1 hypothetical protein GGI25_006051 [Coemansia spiralis]
MTRISLNVATTTSATSNDESESSDSNNNSNTPMPRVCLEEAYASKAIHIACSLLPDTAAITCGSVFRADGKTPMEHAVEYIWQLGLEHPESSLVPNGDYDCILTLQFVNSWAAHVLPALICSPLASPTADLARISRWIASRRRSLKLRGPFWNGRSLCIAEVIVAPFADALLHSDSGFIPDTQEFSTVATWLAAVRCALPSI